MGSASVPAEDQKVRRNRSPGIHEAAEEGSRNEIVNNYVSMHIISPHSCLDFPPHKKIIGKEWAKTKIAADVQISE